ncbi:MAG: Ku protein [Thermoleophilia bacterium]|nr:Ku protein [Thermoleophilia bacterium]
MPRAIWSGSISFGLVNVPVRMYSAIEEKDLHFHFVHEPDGSRIGYEKVCKAEGKAVPNDEIVKAFEYEKGEYVYMSDEDFQAAEVHNLRTIDIRDFVPYEEIDPIYFERTYYLGPAENADKVYTLLREAMQRSGLAAIAKYVMRDKQHLGCLRVRDGVITLEKMYFADEVRGVEGVAPEEAEVDERELEMAGRLVESFSGAFDPGKYEDTYRDALCEIITAKRRGKETHVEPREEPQTTPDLMAALRASLEASKQRRSSARRRGGAEGDASAAQDGELEQLSKDELYERARELDIKGRSDMSKDDLVRALQAAA